MSTQDRLHRLASAHGLTVAEQIEKLVTSDRSQHQPAAGALHCDRLLTAEDIDAELARRLRD